MDTNSGRRNALPTRSLLKLGIKPGEAGSQSKYANQRAMLPPSRFYVVIELKKYFKLHVLTVRFIYQRFHFNCCNYEVTMCYCHRMSALGSTDDTFRNVHWTTGNWEVPQSKNYFLLFKKAATFPAAIPQWNYSTFTTNPLIATVQCLLLGLEPSL